MVLTVARDVRLYKQKLHKRNSEMIIADSLGCCVFSAFLYFIWCDYTWWFNYCLSTFIAIIAYHLFYNNPFTDLQGKSFSFLQNVNPTL